jgi:hypothetical protein
MRLPLHRFSLLTLSLLAVTGACAASGPASGAVQTASSSSPSSCDRSDQDKRTTPHQPLYQGCAVDVQAVPPADALRPTFEPDRRTSFCYSVMLEVAVNTNGIPEMETLRVVKTTHPSFARAVSAVVPGMRFEPARLGGVAVRQLVPIGTMLASEGASC